MDLYQHMARHYDELFPLDQALTDLAASFAAGRAPVLDVGCATGSLVLALAGRGFEAAGIDPDRGMIAIARERAARAGGIAPRPRFLEADMLSLGKHFPARAFGLVLCVGNTLVHLPDEPALAEFLRQARALLAPGGVLLLQIINYDFILSGHLSPFAPIDTPSLLFTRAYAARPDGRLEFKAGLTVKASGRAWDASLPLYPLRRADLERLLEAAGFTERVCWGGFQKQAWRPDGLLLVAAGRAAEREKK